MSNVNAKKSTPKQQGDILRIDGSTPESGDVKKMFFGDFGDIKLQSHGEITRINKDDKDQVNKIISEIMKNAKIKIENNDYLVIESDDGKKTRYFMREILAVMVEAAYDHMERVFLAAGSYAYYYHGKDIKYPGVNTGNEARREHIRDTVNELYDAYHKNEGESEEEREKRVQILFDNLTEEDFIAAIYLWEQIKKLGANAKVKRPITPVVTSEERKLIDFIKTVDEAIGNEGSAYQYLADMINNHEAALGMIRFTYGVDSISDEDNASMFMDVLDKKEIREFVKPFGILVAEKKKLLKKLLGKRIISEEELKESIDSVAAMVRYLQTEDDYLLRFMDVAELCALYCSEKIGLEQVIRYSTLKDILTSDVNKDLKMEILMSGNGTRVYGKTETDIIWKLYEKDYFSTKEIRDLESLRYLHVNSIIRNYLADKKRKIAASLDVIPNVTDEKILDFFTADIVLRELKSKELTADQINFYKEELKAIYEAAGRNLEQELVNELMAKQEEGGTEEAHLECIRLYNQGFLSADSINRLEISESMAINDYRKGKSTKKLIDYFNAGFISQDTLIEMLDDDFDTKLFELIAEGMSARAIGGLYSTKQLIEFTKPTFDEEDNEIPPKLTFEQLAEIKSDINTGLAGKNSTSNGKETVTLLDLYLDGTISYTELYDMAAAGVISKDEADEINDHYNLDQGVAALEKRGVSGQPIGNLFRPVPPPGPKPTPKPGPKHRRSAVGIHPGYIIDFYKRMGAKNVILINGEDCPVFDGYAIIPIIDKKIGFLEGPNGRTYILPLKIILEQINNPRGNMDLIGNATSRNAFNRFKQYVGSTNHTKNWMENTIAKAAEISPVMTDSDVTTFKKKNALLIKNARQNYEYRKANPII